ncbi:MAG: NACHT domain-containing protein, partial [Cyanobacteria bacterium J06649_11]
MSNIKSFEELLKAKYPELFIDFTDLQKIAGRIMIVVDGLDELQGIYDETQEEKYPISEMTKKMIDPKSSILKGHKTIVGGRHNACESIMSNLTHTSIKKVEVCGFNEYKSIEYIERYFGPDVHRADKVKEIIKRPNIRVMANVPVLLFIICLLYSEDFEEEINTVTELYVYGLFAFLRNHNRGPENFGNSGLISLVTSKRFGKIVYLLSILSVKTYMNGQVVFTDNDIKAIGCDLNLEETGLMVKHSIGNFGPQVYQFKHLVFQEFLCSLHLCLTKGVSKYNTNRELSSCTSTILGIHHLVKTKHNHLFMQFYTNLETIHKSSRTLKKQLQNPLNQFRYNKFIKQQQQKIL